ncbi:MAG: methyl-accepting chemotaxis protein [Chitinivibrionia bacterium]|jgi:methyl-accepting chemotaxis protein|nr:methyl-accepting chemotaxis protein [Chitinivibrionia bacterium]
MVLKFWMYRAFVLAAVLMLAFVAITVTLNVLGRQDSYQQAKIYVPLVSHTTGALEQILSAGYEFRAYQYTFSQRDYDLGVAHLEKLETALNNLRTLAYSYPEILAAEGRQADSLILKAREYRRLSAEINRLANNAVEKKRAAERLTNAVNEILDEYWKGDTITALLERELEAMNPAAVRRRYARLISTFDSYIGMGRADVAVFALSRVSASEHRQQVASLALEHMGKLESVFRDLNTTTTNPFFKNLSGRMLDSVVIYNATIRDLKQAFDEIDGHARQRVLHFRAMSENLTRMANEADARLEEFSLKAYDRQGSIIFIAIAALILFLLLAIVYTAIFSKSIIMNINKNIGGLDEESSGVADVASKSSQLTMTVSDTASEQAASLEQMSASLNEITSMIQQTANNAKAAEALVKDSVEKSEESQDAMVRLNEAVVEIQKSSNDTAKILKDIDDIAFQTNLLALNAAVEAARAGEAGKGFAVVAEEVRNLAQRSAESAKKTASLIEGSQNSCANGVNLAGETAATIEKITEASRKLATTIAEITSATQEQSIGVSQLNTTVGHISQGTQGLSDSSQNLATNAQGLASQADTMKEIVSDVIMLIDGKNGGNRASRNVGRFKQVSSNKQAPTALIAFDDD